MDMTFIVNPSSRSGRGERLWGELEMRLKEAGISYDIIRTSGPGDAQRAAARFSEGLPAGDGSEKAKLVILGGDGTLNEAVSGLGAFDRVLLGYVPTGSSNDFARGAGLPNDGRKLFDRIIEGKPVRKADIGRLTYNSMTKTLSRLHDDSISSVRHFIVSAGIGFDAAVCEEALASETKNLLNRIGLGKLTYGAIALKQLFGADRIAVDVEMDGDRHIKLDHFLFAAAMQEPYEGGGFRFAPDAEENDGLLNVCLIGDMSKPRMLLALPRAYAGKHYGMKGVYHYTAKSMRIRTALPMWVHTDGEVSVRSDDITIECLPGALELMV